MLLSKETREGLRITGIMLIFHKKYQLYVNPCGYHVFELFVCLYLVHSFVEVTTQSLGVPGVTYLFE